MRIELGFVKNIFSKHFGKISNLIAEQIKDGWEKFKIDSDIAFNQYLNKSFDMVSRTHIEHSTNALCAFCAMGIAARG